MSDSLDVEALTNAFINAPYNTRGRSVESAIMDSKLPAFVRAVLILYSLNATEMWVLREANMCPTLYARFEGRPCRVTIVSAMGDLGISYDLTKTHGYSRRELSIYDLTDYSQEPPK